MKAPLQLLAGPGAAQQLREHGFDAQRVRAVLGASGGPKWFVLSQIDRVLSASLLPKLSGPVHLIGSSVGAWRMACYARRDPAAAIDRLEEAYVNQTYDGPETGAAIQAVARDWLAQMLGSTGPQEVLGAARFRLHVIAARARRLCERDERLPLSLGLAAAASSNLVSRRWLARHFERYLFSDPRDAAPFGALDDGFRTVASPLTPDNLVEAILASSAIPLLMPGVRAIAGAPQGVYRDGGIVDYHLDLPTVRDGQLALYPHFGPRLIPGWFDKRLRWRQASLANHRNTVVICPSPAFVASLPGGKIPDRSDFQRYDDVTRVRVWQETIDRCAALAEDLETILSEDRWAERLLPLAGADEGAAA